MTTFDDPQIFLPEYISLWAQSHPDKKALICGEVTLTWAELDAGRNRVANALLALGLNRGEGVAVVGDNSADLVLTYWGVVSAGGFVASLSTVVALDSIAMMIRDSGSTTVIASFAQCAVIDGIRDQIPDVPENRFIVIDESGAPPAGWASLTDLTAAAAVGAPDFVLNGDDICNIIYSSGTTGLPKGITHTHETRLRYAFVMASELRHDSTAITLAATALYSNISWTMLLQSCLHGGTLVLMPKFSARATLELIEVHQITHTTMVPGQFQIILEEPDFAFFDISSLRAVCTVGSNMRGELKRRIVDAFPCGLFEVYGLTEGFFTIRKPEDPADKLGSVGRAAMANDLRVIDNDGLELPIGEAGEIVGYCPMLMRGYYRNPEKTEEAIWIEPKSGRTFLRSGDIGRFDEDGYFWLLDRKKDMIVSGGANVYPTDIEGVIGEHEDVSDVAVIGIPHDRWGETPLALVVPVSGAKADADALRDWANKRLGKYQRVQAVEFRGALPRNPAGKVLKRELRIPYWPQTDG